MSEYIVKNCPAGQIVTSAVNPDMTGVYCKMTHGPCQDCKKCTLKDIATYCKANIEFNKRCGLKKSEIDTEIEILKLLEIAELKE